MDPSTFDRWVAAVGQRRTRRTTLRLLGSTLLGALLPRSRSELARAAQIDVAGPPPTGVSLVNCAAQGLTDCGDGICRDLNSNHEFCGSCNYRCRDGYDCVNGTCV